MLYFGMKFVTYHCHTITNYRPKTDANY